MDPINQRCHWLVKYIVWTIAIVAIGLLVTGQLSRKLDILPNSLTNTYAQPKMQTAYVEIQKNCSVARITPSEQWAKTFDFVPTGIRHCQELFKDRNKLEPFEKRVMKLQAGFLEHVEKFKVAEGYSQSLIEEYMLYYELVRAPFVKTVCETGFNAGHSTFMWLAANTDTRVYSFDLGRHGYAKPMAAFLQEMFPDRLTVTWGDSTKTIPKFHQGHPDVRCDLIIIDGGHTHDVALADFMNFKPMASSNNILIFDDYPSTMTDFMQSLGKFWEGRKRRGELLEIFQCGFMPEKHRGFSVGRFNA